MGTVFVILGALLLCYWMINKVFLRRLLSKRPLGNTTNLAFAFVAGLAIGSGNLQPWVLIPLVAAFALYQWPRLKAFFYAIGNHPLE